jgi:ADP-heptose:LPS heptosyltransferase
MTVVKTLIVRLSALGDVVQASPLPALIKKENSTDYVGFLLMENCQFILENNPHIDKIIPFKIDSKRKLSLKLLISTYRLLKTLRSERFDSVIVLHYSKLLSLLVMLAGIKTRVGLSPNPFLTSNIDFKDNENRSLQYQRALRLIGYANAGVQRPTLFVKRQVAQNCIVCNPGGGVNQFSSMPARRMAAGIYAKIFDYLLEKGEEVICIGDTNDEKVVREILPMMKYQCKLVDLSGTLTLKKAIQTVGGAKLYMGNDTGMLHFAIAQNIPTLAFFTAVDGKAVVFPDNLTIFLQSDEPCAPCYVAKDGIRGIAYTCSHQSCRENFDFDKIKKTLNKLLAEIEGNKQSEKGECENQSYI